MISNDTYTNLLQIKNLNISDICCCGDSTRLAEVQYELDILGVKGPRNSLHRNYKNVPH